MVRHDDDLAVYADGEGRRGRDRPPEVHPDGGARHRDGERDADGSRPRSRGRSDAAARPCTARARAAGLVQAGPELALPPGFSYTTFGAFGSAMTDGFITPPIHDGMAVFDGGNGTLRLVRNHELGEGNDIPPGTVIGEPKTAWDKRAPGGTTTLVVDAATGALQSRLDQPERDRHELRRHADAVGHVAHLRGDHHRREGGPAEAARLRLRGGRVRGHAEEDQPDQGDGSHAARGGRGRSRHPASST